METGIVVLTTLKILGAVLFFALAAAFRFGRVFSGWFRFFLIVQGITVLSYNQDVSDILAVRTDHPAGYALGTLPFIVLIPPLFLSVDAAVVPGLTRGRRIIPPFLAGMCLAVVLVSFFSGSAAVLPGPGAHPLTGWIWNAWHVGWILAAGFLLIRHEDAGPATPAERRILAILVGYAAFTIVASIVLESFSYHLDFLVTPALMILAAYAALAVLIAAAPRLIRRSRERYSGSDLDSGAALLLAERARGIVRDRELWKDGSLTLTALAEQCAASPRDLSQAVNQHFGMGFPAWMNTFRLHHAENLLAAPDRKIADIAFESGFNSLSSFNAAFKARHGITPGEWRKHRN